MICCPAVANNGSYGKYTFFNKMVIFIKKYANKQTIYLMIYKYNNIMYLLYIFIKL